MLTNCAFISISPDAVIMGFVCLVVLNLFLLMVRR